jgi:hypothetical protein
MPVNTEKTISKYDNKITDLSFPVPRHSHIEVVAEPAHFNYCLNVIGALRSPTCFAHLNEFLSGLFNSVLTKWEFHYMTLYTYVILLF